MFQWRRKSSKIPAPAAAVVVGEVPVQKVERIEVLNLVAVNKPGHARAGGGGDGNLMRKPAYPTSAAAAAEIVDVAGAGPAKTKADCASRPDDDINWRAGRFIEDTRRRWYLGLKSFRATGR